MAPGESARKNLVIFFDLPILPSLKKEGRKVYRHSLAGGNLIFGKQINRQTSLTASNLILAGKRDCLVFRMTSSLGALLMPYSFCVLMKSVIGTSIKYDIL